MVGVVGTRWSPTLLESQGWTVSLGGAGEEEEDEGRMHHYSPSIGDSPPRREGASEDGVHRAVEGVPEEGCFKRREGLINE